MSRAVALTALFFLLLTHPSILARPTLEITSHSQCLQGTFSSSKPLLEALLQAFLPLAPAITQLPAPLSPHGSPAVLCLPGPSLLGAQPTSSAKCSACRGGVSHNHRGI